MLNENRDGLEIDLHKLLMAYLHRWWLIGICTVLSGILALVITSQFITPLYKASVTVYVNNVRSDQYVEYVSNTNLATAQRLVTTYINIIKSNTVLEKVAEESGTDMTAGQIRSAMSANQMSNTEMFTVTITHRDPKVAAHLANTVAEVAPAVIEEFVEGSSTKIIDYAKVPTAPSSPNKVRNLMLGALLGCVAALAVLTVMFLMDVRINDEEDLSALFELPVLVQIPAFITDGSRNRGYSKENYAYISSVEKGELKK